MGGSFNPAHAGHRLISERALKSLALEQVWWLVNPQNPLKEKSELADYAARLGSARRVARHPRIRVCDFEARFKTIYSVEVLARLQRLFPRYRFVWLAGADLLTELHRWRRWREFMGLAPIAIFDRPGYVFKGLSGRAARRFASRRIMPCLARRLADLAPPAWILLSGPRSGQSATAIRLGRRSKKLIED